MLTNSNNPKSIFESNFYNRRVAKYQGYQSIALAKLDKKLNSQITAIFEGLSLPKPSITTNRTSTLAIF